MQSRLSHLHIAMGQRLEQERSLELGDSQGLLELVGSLEQVGNLEHLELGDSLELGDTLAKHQLDSPGQLNRLEHRVFHRLELQLVDPMRRGLHKDRSRQSRCPHHRLQPQH